VQPTESSPVAPETLTAAIDDALDTLDSLASLGEDIEDEWQYIQDLARAWRERLAAVAEARGGEPLSPARGAAITKVCEEATSITDPHRAIDWLSTFPQVVLVALGERP
jgi:hypothetical protein